jgi:hypothetical protein
MDANQKNQFSQQSDYESNQLIAGQEIEDLQEEPGNPIPDEPTVPEQPDENPEPGIDEPEKDDPTRIDDEPPIFNNY